MRLVWLCLRQPSRPASADSANGSMHARCTRMFLVHRFCSVKHYVQPLYNDMERTDVSKNVYHHRQFTHSRKVYVGRA